MTQVARGAGPGGANRPGIALPIRIHDLLLTLAGRLDDDALADIRQMLASAELDRALEFLAGCLAAGRVVLTREQHAELEALFSDTYLDPSVIDRVMVTDRLDAGRHRFAFGAVDGRDPERGVADAVRPVLGVLPDVRSMWCVWRLTPAGPSSGPVPHLLVLVGIGPGGFPPATAYRVEDALRRAGIRASVEVLMDGVEPDEYHREAMRSARQIPFDGHGSSRPRVEPAYEAPRIESARARVEPARVEPPRISSVPEPPRMSAPEPPRIESPRVEPPRMSVAPEPPRIEPARLSSIQPEPPRVTSVPQEEPLPEPEPPRMEPASMEPPRMESPRMDPPAVDAPRIDSPHVEVRKDPPFGVDSAPAFSEPPRSDPPRVEPPRVDPPTMMTPAAGGLVGPGGLVGGRDEQDQDAEPEPPRVEAVRTDPFSVEPPVRPVPEPQFEQERLPEEPPRAAEQPPSALREETRTDSAPSPSPRRRADNKPKDEAPPPPQEHPSRPRLAPAGGMDKHSQAFVDDILNTQERNLLRELQDELARREQQDPPPSGSSGSWHVDRSGRHGKPGGGVPFEHPNQTTGPMIINGVPPYPDKRGYPPAN